MVELRTRNGFPSLYLSEFADRPLLHRVFALPQFSGHETGRPFRDTRTRRLEDGLALAPYIRESRRIRAERTIVERDLSAAFRSGDTLAERYNDTVGVGYYRIDLHPPSGGDNYIDVASLPFRIPLGALIPVRMENLLPAAKNIGVTHITNGCYRLHPVEWNVGEAAGTLCAYALDHSVRPRVVLHNDRHLAAFQAALECRGVQLRWPENLNLEDGDSHIHARGSR